MRTHLLYLFKTILSCLIIIACALGILLFPNDVRNGRSKRNQLLFVHIGAFFVSVYGTFFFYYSFRYFQIYW